MSQVYMRRSTVALLLAVWVLTVVAVIFIALYSASRQYSYVDSTETSVRVTDSPHVSRTSPASSTTTTQASTTTTSTTTTTTRPKDPWEAEYRIPRSTLPLHYDLYLHPDLETGLFSGKVSILINVTSPMEYIVTHFKKLSITATELSSNDTGDRIPLRDAFAYELNQFWVVRPQKTLSKGKYELQLVFNGSLEGQIVGFYKSVYTTESGEKRTIATSKFQPTDARGAFPCFDEPSFKSTFTTTLVRPTEGYIALSNMPKQLEIADSPRPGLTEVQFEKSVAMVTYLACFIVCDFAYIETQTKNNKKFRVYATSDQINRANYSLGIGVDVLNYYEDYFQLDYPLPKQDMIAIPDFISGAMEHWGLITYRETNLLYDELGSSSWNKQRVASVVAHELAHMWFGNLVTLEWWDDLWLNEGFASYIEYKGVAQYERDWAMEEQFVVDDLQNVFILDSQHSSHPIVQEVNHPDEITELFDTISYSKGASVLRMLEDFIGAAKFREGVSAFLERFKYDNAVTKDLWEDLEKVAPDLKISRIMDSWTRQMGYPVVSVKGVPGGGNKLEVRQSRFLSDPESEGEVESPFGYRWDVPLTYVTDVTERKQVWFYREMDKVAIARPEDSAWVKFNVGQYGYYRVSYDQALWNELIEMLNSNHEKLGPSDRASILDDAFALAEADQGSYDTAFRATAYLQAEAHYIPWQSIYKHLKELGHLLRKSKAYPIYRKFILNLVKTQAKLLGWDDNGEHLMRRKRPLILDLACDNGDIWCLSSAFDLFKKWIDNPEKNRIGPNLRSLVYKYGIQKAGEQDWEVLLSRYVAELNAQEKVRMLSGLASSKEDWILDRFIILASNESLVRSQDYFTVLSAIARNPAGTHIIWNFVRSSWPEMVERFTLNDRYLGRFVKSLCEEFTREQQLEEVMEFFTKYPKAGSGERARKQGLEKLKKNIKWTAKNEDLLYDWLRRHFQR